MTEERKKLVDEIFLNAVEISASEREAFLQSACQDAEVYGEVVSLLKYDLSEFIFDAIVQQTAASVVLGDPMIGARVGPYRITRVIGKGGMGTVFLAVRDDQAFEKTVAVKVVKPGMDSAAVLERFRHERRILANLSHPNICHMLDAGSTADGRPYFVMEYVDGKPVIEYCSSQNMTLTAKLELFRKICDAVSCAHRNLVVHRDLKASNILVTQDGSPKLLDFGIAKLLDPQTRTEDTAPAGRMLTLDCASPEQIRGESVTTSTDIYSLGMLLFALLAGRPPWDLQSLSLLEAQQTICQVAPPKPSAVLRGVDGSDWRALTGDLDNIVLMALRKDAGRRYRSADEFSEDIRRYQTGLPVIAQEDSFPYRAGKFLRRHGRSLAAAAASILCLVAGLIYANVERRRAEVRLNQMLGMANQTLLDLHSQIERQPGSTETRMRITKSTLAYLAGVAKDAGNNQEVRTTLAKAYLGTGDIQGYPDDPNLGDSNGALSSYQEAVKLFSPQDHVPLARLFWHRGVVLFKMGKVPEGLASLRDSIREAGYSSSHEALLIQAGAHHSMAYALTPSDPEKALEQSKQESAIYSTLVARHANDVEANNGLASSYLTTGGALVRRSRLEEAIALFQRATGILEPLVDRHPMDVTLRRDLMNSYVRLGDTLGNPARRNLGNRRAALPYFIKARAIAESLAAADPSNRLAQMDLAETLWRIAAVMDAPEQLRPSLEMLDRAGAIVNGLQSGDQVNATTMRTLSTIEQFRGSRLLGLSREADAAPVFQHGFDLAQTVSRKDPSDSSFHVMMLRNQGGLCRTLASMGRAQEAIRCAQENVDHAAKLEANGPDRPSMAIYLPRAWMWMGQVYETLARRDASPEARRQDWIAAAKTYSRSGEEWQKMHNRADIFRYNSEIADCVKKAAECNQQAHSSV